MLFSTFRVNNREKNYHKSAGRKTAGRIAVIMMLVLALTQVFEVQFSYAASGKDSKKIIVTKELPDDEAIDEYGTYHGTNAKRIPVITYHRVISDKQKKRAAYRNNSLFISQSNFSREMKWLKKNKYRTINCQEFRLWYEGKIKLPKKSVLITFDDSRSCLKNYAFPVLDKYGLKGTVFTIGHGVKNSDKGSLKKKSMKGIQEKYPTVEFQSHTYALHKHFSNRGVYARVKKDAAKQAKYFDFSYVAYPYGYNTAAMRKAYKDSGIKMGFSYGNNGFATRSQNRFQIRRIKIYGNGTMAMFKAWFR